MDGISPTYYQMLSGLLYAHGTSEENGKRIAFRMLNERGRETQTLTWQELHDQVNQLSWKIRVTASPGDRALVMFPPGLDFIVAFLACLYAGVVAVPVNPPRRNQKLNRMVNILKDSQCKLALSTPEIRAICESGGDMFTRHFNHWLIPAEEPETKGLLSEAPDCDPDVLAMLQYTSGSTGSPKGVMITNGNLIQNLELSHQAFEFSQDCRVVSWLPMFHDMGLIGIVLQVVYSCAQCVVMTPASFLRSPAQWLKAISTYRATHTCSPNFGFEHAVRRIKETDLEGVDLSCLRAACCGAEPIRKAVIDAFLERFAAYGLGPDVIAPSYGMAETTLAVTITPMKRGPLYDMFGEPGTPSEQHHLVAACGPPGLNMEVVIADPETCLPCAEGTVGEIWVAGGSVAQGYWKRSDKTRETFQARLRGKSGQGPYLRTGDLGYLKSGELYVTGRLSDLIIIRGRNIYPQDIESLISESHEAFNHGGALAFSISENEEERLVILQEIRREAIAKENTLDLVTRIHRVLSSEMDLAAHDVLLLKPGQVPRTSSGKIARQIARTAYLEGRLEGVIPLDTTKEKPKAKKKEKAKAKKKEKAKAKKKKSETPTQAISTETPPVGSESVSGGPTYEEIADWLSIRAAEMLRRPESDPALDMYQPLSDFGMDSVNASEIAMDLEEQYGLEISPTTLYDHPSICALAEHIHQRLKEDPSSAGLPSRATTSVSKSASVDPSSGEKRQEKARVDAHIETGDIAIIGMAARLPGADSVGAFWEDLLAGRDRVGPVPDSRWPGVAAETDGGAYPNAAGLLEDVAGFDPLFFSISPHEAEYMDPQQRLFLEQAWTALEDAGLADHMVAGKACGVFVGCSDGDYRDLIEAAEVAPSAYSLMGNANAILAARIAYMLDLKGPCVTTDTACSSSLVAIHQACESIRSGECTLALAGGVSILSTPRFHRLADKAGMLAPGGRCRTFAADAEGFVPAEGVGVVVLKPLSRALEDGDRIHAIIKGSGVNQDGRTNGITAPNGRAQTALERSVYERFGLDPSHIGYVEAHGTGTRLGDPIEVKALTAAFRQYTQETGFCAIGSVKTNIGHTLAAAGVASLIKATLVTRDGRIPPSLHCVETNDLLELEQSPFYLVPELREWPASEKSPRLAAVSSFGFSGTNAHVVIEAPPRIPDPEAAASETGTSDPLLLLLSAKTVKSLHARLSELRDWLEGPGRDWPLALISRALIGRRSHFKHRVALIVDSRDDAVDKLSKWLNHAETGAPDASPALLNAADLEPTLENLASAENPAPLLRRLADHYIAGGNLPWDCFPRRDRLSDEIFSYLPLPTYPFDRSPHWVVPPRSGAASQTPGPVLAPQRQKLPSSEGMRAMVEHDLIDAVSTILKMEPDTVDLSADIREFGFDSINVVELADTMNSLYDTEVTPPELFEHQSLESLLEALLDDYGPSIAKVHARRKETTTGPTADDVGETPAIEAPGRTAGPVVPSTLRSFAPRQGEIAADPIAIVGIAGTLPGAERLQDFHARLLAGDDLTSLVPENRWDWRNAYGDPMAAPGQTRVNRGGFIGDVDQFDAGFFGLSRKEANLMDPQHRLFLQTAWHAIENAGIRPADLAGTRTGVFVGIFTADYSELLINSGYIKEAHAITGLAHTILPNRLSYLLDLHGPSIPVDTACSSSLVALHQAVESIRAGSSEMALVGGVNLMLSQTQFMSASRAGMICEDGHCKSFDKSANGYARGEGVGAILIKPLSRALADGNPIHAVICGTAVNHGGAANSLTSPNPEAQADVIVRAMESAGSRPDRVTYVEAHGTGTSLGDPIEINGLKKAYARLYAAHDLKPEAGACAIGTVKSAIGHLEAAAGVAALLKVVMALKERRLHGNIHLKEVNPYINLDGSPFRFVTDGEYWKPLHDEEGDPLPRRAGISSFGFGGANAHVVLEEWPQEVTAPATDNPDRSWLFPLSARAPDRLTAAARALADQLREQHPQPHPRDVAHTLQQGRSSWSHRVAFNRNSINALIEALEAFASETAEETEKSVGVLTPANRSTALSADTAAQIDAAVKTRDLERLADLWCQGAEIPWHRLNSDETPRLIPLPGYPFAPSRHWLPEAPMAPANTKHVASRTAPVPEISVSAPQISPEPASSKTPGRVSAPVTSPLNELRSDAVYFTDHVVAGQAILPGAHLVEILRAHAARTLGRPITFMSAIHWQIPITQRTVKSGIILTTAPSSDNTGDLVLSVGSSRNRGAGQTVIHGQAVASTRSGTAETPVLDLPGIRARCPRQIYRESLYESLAAAGLAYGKAFQPVCRVVASETESLGELELPDAARAELAEAVLPSSLLDGAFQCIAAIIEARLGKNHESLFVPYRIETLEILAPLPERIRVHSRLRNVPKSGKGWHFDLDLADGEGRILVTLRDMELRQMSLTKASRMQREANMQQKQAPNKKREKITASESVDPVHAWTTTWVNTDPPNPDIAATNGERLLVLSGREEGIFSAPPEMEMIRVSPHDRFEALGPGRFGLAPDIADGYDSLLGSIDPATLPEHIVLDHWTTGTSAEDDVVRLFHLLKAMTAHRGRLTGRLTVFTGGTSDRYSPESAALAGILKSAAAENSKLRVRLVELDATAVNPEVLLTEAFDTDTGTTEIRRSDRLRLTRRVVDLLPDVQSSSPLKKGGVYWVTGGAGGIGRILALYLARTLRARLILSGRRVEDPTIGAVISDIAKAGGEAIYLKADVCDSGALEQAIVDIENRFGRLDGVFHGAGLLRDSLIPKKTVEDLQAVLAPKIHGLTALDAAIGTRPLDVFAAFSSVSGVMGNMGQCDYAAANAYMDAFLVRRDRQVAEGVRQGRNISINWPLWTEGGMTVPDAVRPMITRMTGMTLLDNTPAMAAFEIALCAGQTQIIPATGDRDRIATYLGVDTINPAPIPKQEPAPIAAPEPQTQASTSPAPAPAISAKDDALLRRKTETYLIDTFSDAVGMNADEVEANTPFQSLGVDSFIVLQLINDLEAVFGQLPKTLLFENHCVADLADYFIDEHEESLRAALDLPAQPSAPASPAVPAVSDGSPMGDAAIVDDSIALGKPIVLAERDLGTAAPDVARAITDLTAAHGGESSAMGRGNFAPLVFLGKSRSGLFYCNRKDDLFVTFGYVGPAAALEETLSDVEAYCSAEGLHLTLIEGPDMLECRDRTYTATPFAVLQRVNDLPGFSLAGKAMRRLRYQVGKFDRADAITSTREYTVGDDSATDAAIIGIIDRWSDGKVMVNPYVARLLEAIRAGHLSPAYRVFLTEQDSVIWNVIIISAMPSHGGYLMDCEFYPGDIPQGGLEFAIIKIIDQLRSEGCRMFSLGVTWGAQTASQGEPDPAVSGVMDELAEKGIFDGRGNLQFKNKFRPTNSQIYLYQKRDETRERVLEIILMIANSKNPETGATETPVTASGVQCAVAQTDHDPTDNDPTDNDQSVPDHRAQLDAAGRNPANIAAAEVDIDLATDSWAKLDRIWMVPPREGTMGAGAVRALIRDLFPFRHMVLTHSGDEAERCLWAALERPKKVLQTAMFPTVLMNAMNNGYRPEEIAWISPTGAPGPLIDLALLETRLNEAPNDIGAICLELLNNATGGWPVPVEHLEAVKALTAPRGIPLILDATRILDNALALLATGHENDTTRNYDTDSVWEEARRCCAVADIVTVSLSKNLMVRQGGLIAADDAALIGRVKARAEQNGLTLEPEAVTAIGCALSDPDRLMTAVTRRQSHVARLAAALRAANIPLAQTPTVNGALQGGHAVLVHVMAMEAFRNLKHPLAVFLDTLYRKTGIRGGLHSTGLNRNPPLDGMIRLAVPVGMPEEEIAKIEQHLSVLSSACANPESLELVSRDNGFAADVTARYRNIPPMGDGGNEENRRDDTSERTKDTPKENGRTPSRQSRPHRGGGSHEHEEDIAIIGMAGRYPQADRLDDFWKNLLSGRDCIERRPLARFGEILPQDHPDIPTERWGGFINDVDRFDSLFFGISPREAAMLDPQERLFMEIAWETLEDAGYTPETLEKQDPARKIGVYVGAVWQLYQILGSEQTQTGNLQTGNSLLWSVANRVSTFLNVTGPSIAVDTACSGSLAAIHLACQAIRSGACSAALVGGVNFDLHASKWLLTEAGGFLSPDGRCKAFGKDANGYVAGEGIGAVLLKPLSRALADGDNIHGVIKSCTINHGGQASGYSVPNPNAQADLVAEAIEEARIDPRTISYIEAHGTGTALGDPIEVQGLTNAFARFTDQKGFCALGSVKSNIGHLEAAAGLAGLAKVLLQMRHHTLVPSLHCTETNELISFADTPFRVQNQAQTWQSPVLDGRTQPLRAGLSSFGAGGTNVHMIVEEAPPRGDRTPSPEEPGVNIGGGTLFPLSARTEEQLQEAARRLDSFLEDNPDVDLENVSFSLRSRKPMSFRLAVVARTREQLRTALTAYGAGKTRVKGLHVGSTRDSKELKKMLTLEEVDDLARHRLESGQAEDLAQGWVRGLLATLDMITSPLSSRRISLPTYPFEHARHWFKTGEGKAVNLALAGTSIPISANSAPRKTRPHPLLDRLEPSFDGVLFRKKIDPAEYVFTDHIVADRPTLPGVAYIEMACAAHIRVRGTPPARIRNLIWAAPITGDTQSEISIRLDKGDGVIACTVTTQPDGQPEVMHAQAKLVSSLDAAARPAPLDLTAIRAQFDKHTSRENCYEMLSHLHFRYGECLRAIDGVEHNDSEGLTRLVLPAPLQADFGSYFLHPSLMDGAVQSIISVVQNEQTGAGVYQPYVPFVVSEIDIHHPLTPLCFAYIRLKKGPRDVPDIKKVDVTLVDETGRVLVEMRDFALKAFSMEELAAVVGGEPGTGARPPSPTSAKRPSPALPDPAISADPVSAPLAEDIVLQVSWE